MKEELLQLYRNNLAAFKSVVQAFPHDDLAGPFLMSPTGIYSRQENPLLVIGQETSGWSYFVDDPGKQMSTYETFDVGRGQNTIAFWNTVRKIETALGNEPHSCAWTNVSKFDFYGGRSHGKYEKAIAGIDNLLLPELKILQPRICLFFTGPYFDARLSKVFKGLHFEPQPGWDTKQLCQLKHPDLPELTFRSYHPRFLRLKCLEQEFVDYVSQVITDNVGQPRMTQVN